MVSTHTQNQLALLFRTIAKGEREIELSRQTLDRNSGFESYTAFKRIDRYSNDALSTVDVQDFLEENYISVSDKGVRNLFNAYSSNGGTRLSYIDFQKLVLSKVDPPLSYKCLGRKVQAIQTDEYLYDDVERNLARLIQKEINFLLKVEEIKEDLSTRHDFTLVGAFNLIDEGRSGAISFDALHRFLKGKIDASRDDVEAIFARFDKNMDHRLNYSEFSALIQPTSPHYRVSLTSDSVYKSPRKTFTQFEGIQPAESIYFSPAKKYTNEDYHDYLKETARTTAFSASKSASGLQELTSEKNMIFDSPSPVKVSSFTESPSKYQPTTSRFEATTSFRESVSPVKEKFVSFTSPRKMKETGLLSLKDNEKRDLARFLKDALDLDKGVEKLKNELVLQRSYNALATFRLFDTGHKGYITRGQLEDGLKTLNINPTKSELYLVMRRLDKNEDGLIRFKEFAQEIEPQSHGERNFGKNDNDNEEVELGVKTILRKLFNKIISAETNCEELRKSISKKGNFTIYESFHSLKQYALGWITASTFKDLLNDQGIYASDDDAEILLTRYDRNKNGKVSYSEFVDEIVQKIAVSN